MIVALFALPALMRFVTPMVGAVASGGGAGAGAAVGAMATGAVSMGRGGSGRAMPPPPRPARKATSQRTSPKGSTELPAPRGSGGQPTPGSTGPGGAYQRRHRRRAGNAGAGAGAAAGSAGAASGAAKAAGPAGMAVAAGAQAASRTSEAAQQTAQDSTGHRRAPVAAINTEYKEPSYGNWRVPRSAGLGNLGAIGTGIVMAGLLLGIISFAFLGPVPGPGRPGRRRGQRPAADGQGQARPVRC